MNNLQLEKLPAVIEAVVKILLESNAGTAKAIGRGADGKAQWAIIVVDAGEDTEAILRAVEAVEDSCLGKDKEEG